MKVRMELKAAQNGSEGGGALISAIRKWAGFSLDECCASCEGQFYSREGSPVCMGCLRDSDYQRSLVRRRLLRALKTRLARQTSIDEAFYRELKSRPVEWQYRAIAGLTCRQVLGSQAAFAHGWLRAVTVEEREAWKFGWEWPDR